jgi:hypothetical protein
MADSITATYRPIYLEDLAVSPTLATTTDTVMGVGPNVPMTPIVIAGSDAAAASAGVPVGGIYFKTVVAGVNYLAARLS